MQMTLGYPIWYVGLCLLAGAVVTGILYYRDTQFKEQGKWLQGLLALLRFTAVSLIAFLLLSPVLRFRQREVRKPIIALAQDVSESVRASMSATEREAYFNQLEALKQELADDFEVHEYSFGASVREGVLDTTLKDKSSNLSEALRTIGDVYSGEALGAVLLASDGIFNAGTNPLYARNKINAPIFTLALGDTIQRKDLVLKRVFYNQIAYLDDQFSIQADISANNCTGSTTSLSVYKVDGDATRLIQQLSLPVNQKEFFKTQEIILDADKPGVQRFRLVLGRIPGEASFQNNVQEIFVDVLDARQKILILAHSPHPDISALKQSISGNKNYQVETAFIGDFNGNIAQYDLVILHQLPSRSHDLGTLLSVLNKNRIPRWFIGGLQTDFNRLNQVQNLVAFQADARSVNEVQAKISPTFNLFLLDEKLRNELPNYPPMSAPFGDFRAGAQAQTLLFQRIRKIDTNYPLLAFGEGEGTRTGLITAEGLWRWRLFNFLQDENHLFFDELMSKIVQYLSVKEDKRKFRAIAAKNIFDENEPVLFDAELYNNSFERINEPDVRLVITNANRKEFSFTMNKKDRAYALNAGIFPVGNYRYTASVNLNGVALSSEGQFSVQPVQLELFDTQADHSLLSLLSEQSGGKRLAPKDIQQLPELIRQSATAKPIVYETTRTRSLIHLRWIFGVLLALLATEWFLRRYFGSY